MVHNLECWGAFACATRAETKVERFSYPCLTPGAARGILDAIYFKPQFRWQVEKIEIMSPVEFVALRRNEVKENVNASAVEKWMDGRSEPEPIWADGDKGLTGSDERGRTQRQTIALRDVRYRIHARILPWPGYESRQKAFDEQFIRRASHGKCFQQPYFGCREFIAYFELSPADIEPPAPFPPINQKLGWMVYDTFDQSRIGNSMSPAAISLFRAEIVDNVLVVPPYESDAVLKVPLQEGR